MLLQGALKESCTGKNSRRRRLYLIAGSPPFSYLLQVVILRKSRDHFVQKQKKESHDISNLPRTRAYVAGITFNQSSLSNSRRMALSECPFASCVGTDSNVTLSFGKLHSDLRRPWGRLPELCRQTTKSQDGGSVPHARS